MAIYIIEIIWVFLCAPICKYEVNIPIPRFSKKSVSGKLLYLILVFGFLGVVMALRAPSIGSDTNSYCNMFKNIAAAASFQQANQNANITAPVYVGYAYLISRLTNNPQIITIINSLIITVGMSCFIYRASSNVIYSSFLYIGFTLYYESMNGARQFIAVVLALNAFVFLVESIKSKRGWILFLLALGIHNTAAIFLIAIAGIEFAKHCKKKMFLISIIASLVLSQGFFLLLPIFLRCFPYYKMYVDGSNPASILANSGKGRIICVYILLAVVVLLYYLTIKGIKKPETTFNYYSLPAVAFCVVVGIIFSRNILVNRLLWFFVSLFIVFIPDTFKCYNKKYRQILYGVTTLSLLVYSIIQLVENQSGIVPYRLFF